MPLIQLNQHFELRSEQHF